MGLDSGILTPRLLGLMALTGRRQTEIFFSAKFSLPKKKLPFPALIFEGELKTRHAPGTSFEPYPIPVLADPKKIIRALALPHPGPRLRRTPGRYPGTESSRSFSLFRFILFLHFINSPCDAASNRMLRPASKPNP